MKFTMQILGGALVVALGVGSAHAASVHDLRVSYYDSAANTEAKKAQIAATFQNFAEAVYEMTNGVHRIGKVSIYTDGLNSDNADVVWRSGVEEECWFSAAVNGRGHAGVHILHCEVGSLPEGSGTITFKTLEQPRASGYTLSHEWGHFFYGLFDEYQTEGPCSDDSSPCTTDVGVNNSLMNDPLIGVNRDDDSMAYLEWVNFSSSANNPGTINPDTGKASNAQFRTYGANAWDTLVRPATEDSEFARQSAYGKARKFYPDLKDGAPAAGLAPSLEINTPEGQTAARNALQIEWLARTDARHATRTGGTVKPLTVRIVLVDRQISAGMLEEVKAAVQALVDSAEASDTVAVATLGSAGLQVISSFTALASEAARDTVIQAVEQISPDASTAESLASLAGVLNTALTGLASQWDGATASVYLFAPAYKANTLLSGAADTYRNARLMLYAFDLGGDDAAGTLLRRFAEQTKGLYAAADTPDKLQAALQLADMDATPTVDTLLAADETSVSNTQEFAFTVDPTLGEVETSVSYPAASAVTLALIDPQGSAHPFAAEDCGDVERAAYADKPAEITCFKQTDSPAVGAWKLRISAAAPVKAAYHIVGYPLDNGKTYFTAINTDKLGNGSLVITAQVGNDMPLTGILVQAKVGKPDGETVTVPMRDDGAAPDFKAQDGVYSGQLANAADGDYLVAVSFHNHNGTAQFSNTSVKYAGIAVPAPRLTPMAQDFTRVALYQTTVLSPYKRVMNWGEAVVAPALLPMRGKQEFDSPPYHGRFYPASGLYLAYNTQDGNLYLLDQAVGWPPQNLGALANYLSQAAAAGF